VNDEPRRGLSFGFGLAGLLSAGLAYFAFEEGLFAGPAWRNTVLAIAIGGGSAAVLLSIERMLSRKRRPDGSAKPVKMKGPWGCPRCGAAYVPEATECSDCHVPLVANPRAVVGSQLSARDSD
jgi:hypothetical protein